MPRTPLFNSLRRAFRIAALSIRDKSGIPSVDEIVDTEYSRRRFIRDSTVGIAALAAAGLVSSCGSQKESSRESSSGVRIAIVGGGIAGLNTAYKLQKAGLKSDIFEGSDRTGGRILTASNLLGDNLTTELGGEFIDSAHEEILGLITEFGFERIDTQGPGPQALQEEAYFFDGQHYTIAQAARAFLPFAKRISADFKLLDEIDYKTEAGSGRLDHLSIAQYLDEVGVTGWLRGLLDVAYVTEGGLDTDEQSALNFLFLVGTGNVGRNEPFVLLGDSDERYKVKGGNQRLVDELARRLEPQIHRRHRLEAIEASGQGFNLTFQTDGGVVGVHADVAVLAIPFTMLREVSLQVPLSPLKRKAIQELGYGANAKVLVGFKSRPWQNRGYAGTIYSDAPFQLAWDNSSFQGGTAGGLTLYSGGKRALEAGIGTVEEVAARLMSGIERAFPGTIEAENGKVSRFHWPTFRWTKGSYSCYKTGQWTAFAGSESLPEGNLFFAGEHCSDDFGGFMNGAAQSGADVARSIAALSLGGKAAQIPSRGYRLAV